MKFKKQNSKQKTERNLNQMKMFSIFDSKAAAYMTPFTLQSSAHAIRQIAEMLLQPQPSPFSDYPEDFTLMEIGEWDQLTGEIRPFRLSFPTEIYPS